MSNWEQPIKDAMRYNAEQMQKPEGADGYCPVCAWPLVEHNGEKVCNCCEWRGNG